MCLIRSGSGYSSPYNAASAFSFCFHIHATSLAYIFHKLFFCSHLRAMAWSKGRRHDEKFLQVDQMECGSASAITSVVAAWRRQSSNGKQRGLSFAVGLRCGFFPGRNSEPAPPSRGQACAQVRPRVLNLQSGSCICCGVENHR
ncbi:unnamed protein product [Cyprideis torosa]|uniref:Uncharacterized protein n=1 Tax=Cyprideis torosa TaxID=163714 RepID=A0A7R8ZUG2_9CRUS|nr:unnamed protein product [Cyprideis torosa]CAG0909548.1 unnamed protein product [Cyprideis torosa]